MTEEVTIIPWNPSQTERKNGPWRLTPTSFVKAEEFETITSLFVEFGPTSWAGNHRHVQKELLICVVGDVYLIWRDKDGMRHEEKMRSADGSLRAFLIHSNVPHLMENRSHTEFATVQVWYGIEEPELLKGSESLR